MGRERSEDLPRYVSDNGTTPAFRWRRRHWIYVACALLIFWVVIPRRQSVNGSTGVTWSNFAYSLYATDSATLCHAVLLFSALAKLGSKADRVLFYPDYWDTKISDSKDRTSQLLVMARDIFNVKLQPIRLLIVEGRTSNDGISDTWDKSVTKFMAFSLTYYDRVIALDSDITLLQHLDDLFLLPQTPIAMPRAYWYHTRPWPLTSLLMVLKPDMDEFEKFKRLISGGGDVALVDRHKFDMELLNERFEDSALVLPHRPFALLSGEFRRHNHTEYLGNADESWDAEKVIKEARLVHFSDWPLPKPWIMWPAEGLAEMQPDCGGSHEESCAERGIWKGLYEDFRARRKDTCRLLSVPAPAWVSIKGAKTPSAATDGTQHEAVAAERGSNEEGNEVQEVQVPRETPGQVAKGSL